MANIVVVVLWTLKGWLDRHCLMVGWLVGLLVDRKGKRSKTYLKDGDG